MTDGIIYRGDSEDERRESAVMHTRMLDHINRLQRMGFPLTDGDMLMFQYLEAYVIEVPEGYAQPTAPAPAYTQPPEPVPGYQPPVQQQQQQAPAAPPVPSGPQQDQPAPAPTKAQRGRLRPVD